MADYWARQSERESGKRRTSKTYRLLPEIVEKLDRLAREQNVSQARLLEDLIEEATEMRERS